MFCAFTFGFQKVYKSCLLLLVSLPGLIDALWHSCQLEVLAMFVYDVATKVLDTEIFPQHTIADLISGITFVIFFSQETGASYTNFIRHLQKPENYERTWWEEKVLKLCCLII